MRLGKFLVFFSLMAGAWIGCAADEVQLQNGDRITGKVVSVEAGKLSVETEYAGTVEIDWDKVRHVHTDERLTVQAAEWGRWVQATDVARLGGDIRLDVGGAQQLQVPVEAVTAIRSQRAQRAYEDRLQPGLLQAWTGEVSTGFAFARGNSEVTNLSTGVNASRQTLNDKAIFYTNSVYSTDRALSSVVANAIRGGFRYDKDFSRAWFGFGSADFEYDDLQNLDLRSINGGGIGWHAIRAESATLDLLGGTVWTRESYTFDPERNFVGGKFGEEFTARLWPGSQLKQRGFYHPDLNDTSQYRVAVDISLSSRINSWLSWQTAVSERFTSNPPIGTRSNDLLITTGIGFRLGNNGVH